MLTWVRYIFAYWYWFFISKTTDYVFFLCLRKLVWQIALLWQQFSIIDYVNP